MAYLGQAPINGFHAKQQLTGDGSTVTYTLDQTVATETSIIVSVGGVLQEPSTAYDLAEGGTKITFTEAPASTDRVYIQFLGKAVVQNMFDVNGVEFVLDADADTSFTADTDDEIDIKVGGTDINTIKATGFHNIDSIKYVAGTGDDLEIYHDGTNSFVANKTGALKLATETSGIAITLGHTTSEVTVADNLTVAGDMTVTGTASFADANITNVGSIALDTITNDGTDITLDSSGDIILDAGGDTIFLKDSGTTFGSLDNTSGNLIIKSGTTTAATFCGANVTFAGTIAGTIATATQNSITTATGLVSVGALDSGSITSGFTSIDVGAGAITTTGTGTIGNLVVDDVAVNGKVITMTGSSGDTAVMTVAANGSLTLVTTDAAAAAANIQITADGTAELAGTTVTLDSSGGITLDADGGTITFADAGSSLGTITSSGYMVHLLLQQQLRLLITKTQTKTMQLSLLLVAM